MDGFVAGEPVMRLFRRIALTFLLVSGVAALGAGAHAQPASSTPPSASGATHAIAAADSKASAQGIDSRINTAGIIKRLNQELGIDLEATTAGWQRELDRLESDLAGPNHRYSDLNRYRDELQRIRIETDNARRRIQPPLEPIGRR